MTTATAPPLLDEPTIDVNEMPALGDREPVCELLSSVEVGRWNDCDQPAVWVIRARGAECGHMESASVLACDSCLRDVLAGKKLCCPEPGCEYAVYIDGVIRL